MNDADQQKLKAVLLQLAAVGAGVYIGRKASGTSSLPVDLVFGAASLLAANVLYFKYTHRVLYPLNALSQG